MHNDTYHRTLVPLRLAAAHIKGLFNDEGYWVRKPASSFLHLPSGNVRRSGTQRIVLEKDFFSDKTLPDHIVLAVLSMIRMYEDVYLEHSVGIYQLMHNVPGGNNGAIVKFRAIQLSPRMSDEVRTALESALNKGKKH